MNCHGEAKAKWPHCPSFSRGTDCLSDPTGELHLSFLIGVRENANSLSLSFERHVSILSPFSKTKSQNQIRGPPGDHGRNLVCIHIEFGPEYLKTKYKLAIDPGEIRKSCRRIRDSPLFFKRI